MPVIVAIVFLLVGVAVLMVRHRKGSKATESEARVDTEFGPFWRKGGGDWFGFIRDTGGDSLDVQLPDRDGAPDPEHLLRLPTLAQEVRELIPVALAEFQDDYREEGYRVRFDSVSLGPGIHELTLSFALDYEEAESVMSVFVDFRDGQVADVTAVD